MLLSSLRNFFIALFISILGFGIGAYFLTGFVNKLFGDFIDPTAPTNEFGVIEDNTDNSGNSGLELDDEEEDLSIFTALIIGIDDGKSQSVTYEDRDESDEKKEADTILLVNINAITKTIMMSSLPSNMKVDVGGYSLRLGSVYTYGEYGGKGTRGMKLIKDTVWSYTGLTPDYCFVLDYDSLEVLFDALGEIEYEIPENLYHKPVPYDVTTTNPPTEEEPTTEYNYYFEEESTEETTNRDIIDIKKGKNMIDGATAVQLLRYKNYKDNELNRTLTQIDFIKEVIRQQMTMENLTRAEEIYEIIKETIIDTDFETYIKTDFKTDFTADDFIKYAKTLFSLSEFTLKEITYPSNSIEKVENGTLFFFPDIKGAQNRYREYRKVEKIESTTENVESTELIEITE